MLGTSQSDREEAGKLDIPNERKVKAPRQNVEEQEKELVGQA